MAMTMHTFTRPSGPSSKAESSEILAAATEYTRATHGSSTFYPGILRWEDIINADLTVSLTRGLRSAFGSDRMLAVVYQEQNPQHAEGEVHSLSVYMRDATGYANKEGMPYLAVFFSCARSAELFQAILDNPLLEPLKIGVIDTVVHEMGHMKAVAAKRSMPNWKKFDYGSETFAELYALSRLEGASRRNGIDALAAVVAITSYLKPHMTIEEIAGKDLKRLGKDSWIEGLGLTKFRYFTDPCTEAEVLERARKHLALLGDVLGDPRAPSLLRTG